MMLTRRSFLTSAVALTLPLPVLAAPPRVPYLKVNDPVDSLVFHEWHRPHVPIGPLYVAKVGNWNGSSYDIVLMRCGWKEADSEYLDAVDADWSFFRHEVPEFNWRDFSHDDFPCIHAYVRWKRYGESPEVMRAALDFNRTITPPLRQNVPLRKTI